jgi:hypothetical protein
MKNLDSYFKNIKKNNFTTVAQEEKSKINITENDNYRDISTSAFKDIKNISDKTTANEILSSSQFKNIDYSDFSNHVFFDSAVHKVSYSFESIINYPYDKKENEVYEYFNDLDGYTEYVLENIYPKHTGGIKFSGSEKVLIKDKKGYLLNDFNNNKLNEGYLSPQTENYSFRFWLNIANVNINTDNQVIFKKIKNDQTKEGFVCFISKSGIQWNLNYLIVLGNNYFLETHTLDSDVINNNFHVTINCSVNDIKKIKTTFLINGNLTDSTTISSLDFELFSNDFQKKDVEFIIGNSEQFEYNNIQYNNFSGALDEFIYLDRLSQGKVVKLQKDDNIFTNDFVKLYLKFNEPGGDYTNSNLVIDSSGNKYHGLILDNENNTITDTSNLKSFSSMLSKEIQKYSPVIIGSFQEIVNRRSGLLTEARKYDINNANIIFKLIPKHYFITSGNFENKPDYISQDLPEANVVTIGSQDSNLGFEANNKNNNLSNICLIWARFFDQLKLHVDAISNLQKCDYDDINNEKYVNAQIQHLCKLYNVDFVPIFQNISKEKVKSRNLENDDVISEHDFVKVQNLVWKKILVNSQDIIRSKGTRHSINSLIKSIGVDINKFISFNEKSFNNMLDLSRLKSKKEEIDIYNMNFFDKTSQSLQTQFSETGIPINKPFFEIENIKYKDNDILKSGLSKDWSIESIFEFNNLIKNDKYIKSIVKNKKDHLDFNLQQSIFRLDVKNNCFLNLYAKFKNSDSDFCDLVLDIDPINVNPLYRKNIVLENVNIFDVANYVCVSYEYDTNSDDEFDILQIDLHFDKYNTYDTTAFYKNVSEQIKIRKNIYSLDALSFYNNEISLRVGEYSYDIDDVDINRINNVFENLTPTAFEGEISSVAVWRKKLSFEEVKNHIQDILSIKDENLNFKGTDNNCIVKVINEKIQIRNNNIYNISTSNIYDIYTYNSLNNIRLYCNENSNFENSFRKIKINRSYKDVNAVNNIDNNLITIGSFSKEENRRHYDNKNENPSDKLLNTHFKNEIDLFSFDFVSSKMINNQINKILLNLDEFNNNFLTEQNRTDYDYQKLRRIRDEYFSNFDEKKLFDYDSLYLIFKYFDNILNEMLTEMIPSKLSFKGFNFVYESHILERFNYNYKNKIYDLEKHDAYYVQTPRISSKRNKY